MPTVADACPACGGQLVNWRSVPSSEPTLAGEQFRLVRCARCGTAVTLGDAPGELHESGAYNFSAPHFQRVLMPILKAFDRHRLSLLAPYLELGASLLDVGAGRGRFVSVACASGYRARGVEPSRRGVSGAMTIGVRLEQASVEDAQIADSSLDAVSLWHVLEHVDHPRESLGRIAGWLRPGGVLLVGVPNLASVQARVGGATWYHLDVPRHRTHFTAAGIETLIRECGLRPLRSRHVLAEHNPFGMWQSVVNRATHHPSYLYNLLKRNAPLSVRDLGITALAMPLFPLAATAELLAGLANRGGTIAVLARREPVGAASYH